jgi:glutathione S-transferase
MRLYDFPASPHCLKVRAVAHELGVDLEIVEVNILRGESRSRDFERLNPNGLVPVLVVGDFVLWESNAILTYLASTHRSRALQPTDALERADVDRWLHWQSAHLGPAVSRVAFERFVKPLRKQSPTDHVAAARAVNDFETCCGALEVSLGGREYVASHLSVADFAIACILSTAARVELGVEAFPRTKAWLGRILARASVRRAVAEAEVAMCRMVRDEIAYLAPS